MSRFGMIVEDPFYDEDGVLIDEDAEWEDLDKFIDGKDESYDPYGTINS